MDEMPELEGGVPSMDNCDAFAPLESDGAGSAEAAPTEPQQVNLNLPEVEKRRKRVSIYWKRPKSHLYEYNYDYGSNYYKVVQPFIFKKLMV
jgi:hypothetical protein